MVAATILYLYCGLAASRLHPDRQVSRASSSAIQSTDNLISNARVQERSMQAFHVTRISFDGDPLDPAVRRSLQFMRRTRAWVCACDEIWSRHLHFFPDGILHF